MKRYINFNKRRRLALRYAKEILKKLKIEDSERKKFLVENDLFFLYNEYSIPKDTGNSEEYKKYLDQIKNFNEELENIAKIISTIDGIYVTKIKYIPKNHSDIDLLVKKNLGKLTRLLRRKGYRLIGIDKKKKDLMFVRKNSLINVELHTSFYFFGDEIIKREWLSGYFTKYENISIPYLDCFSDFLTFLYECFYTMNTTPSYKGYNTITLSDMIQFKVDLECSDKRFDAISRGLGEEYEFVVNCLKDYLRNYPVIIPDTFILKKKISPKRKLKVIYFMIWKLLLRTKNKLIKSKPRRWHFFLYESLSK